MGSVGERLTDAAEPLQLPSMRRVPAFCTSPSLRKSVSVPHLPSMDASGMEVYVSFSTFLKFSRPKCCQLVPQSRARSSGISGPEGGRALCSRSRPPDTIFKFAKIPIYRVVGAQYVRSRPGIP